MKKFVFLGLVSVLMFSGFALADQSEKQKESSKQGMMQQMMGGENAGEGVSGMGGMTNIMGMMGRMNEMMDQCTAMMNSDQTPEDQGDQDQ